MEVDWNGVALYAGVLGAFALGMTLWVMRMRRHPFTRMTPRMSIVMEWTRRGSELIWSFIYAVVSLIAIWLVLEWLTHAVSTGQLTPLFPRHSPWLRFISSHRLRPWNFVGIGLFVALMTATFYGLYHWPLRIIDVAVRRVSASLGLSVAASAAVFVADWRAKYLDPAMGALDMSNTERLADDYALISNRCWALYRDSDPSKILVVSYGQFPTLLRREARNVVWTCLYVRKGGHGGGHALTSAARQRLSEQKFEINDLSSGLRIACTRDGAKFGMRPVREAADPERLAALWRSNEGA